ncbi:sensor histidine kinase [Hymenobacter latericus]|uniref:sensor histidine kinase n=1 Tax=Hymenobacter sp. YIM 151858-1 TaxID=2987688 RepID=UPI0022276ED1|nr:histidine kinase [Hymenobacter sp. YIM 151858-1]UYZ59506.1 histidine kinase [Hymenobacter sp. YIM 151858-1]
MSTLFPPTPDEHEALYAHNAQMPPVRFWQRYSRRRWLRLGLTILALTFSIGTFACTECWGDARKMTVNYAMTFVYSLGLWVTNGYAVDWLDRYANWRREPVKRLVLTLLTSLGGSLVVIAAINFWFLVIYRGYDASVMLQPGVMARVVFPLLVTTIISLVLHSRSFLMSWREALIRNERLQKEMAQAEAETLRQQLDPHFMFNALNALTSLVEEEPKLAVRFIRQLSQVYRYVLDARGRDVVPLRDELAFAQSYLFLQRIRYGEALQAELPDPESVSAHAVVPPLSLQLLIENALKHNVATAGQPLHLRIELDGAGQHLRVVNNLRPRRLAPGESMGIGLPNLQGRYRHLTKKQVQVQRTATEFAVTLPVLALEDSAIVSEVAS